VKQSDALSCLHHSIASRHSGTVDRKSILTLQSDNEGFNELFKPHHISCVCVESVM